MTVFIQVCSIRSVLLLRLDGEKLYGELHKAVGNIIALLLQYQAINSNEDLNEIIGCFEV